MERLGRVQKNGRRTGASQRGRDLPADDSRLAHAGDDDLATALEQDADRTFEAVVDALDQRQDRRRFDLKNFSREREVDGHAVSSRAVSSRAVTSTAVSRLAASMRDSLRMSGSSLSSRSALAASLFARDGSSWTSMNTASTPAATPAAAIGSMY